MKRLTVNKDVSEMNMVELAHNCCYAKDGNARYRDFDTDIDARQMAMQLLKKYANVDEKDFSDDLDFDDAIYDCLQYGTDNIVGLIALFYRNLWAMADLRETLKYYEELDEKGMLIKIPVAKGDTIYPLLYANGKPKYVGSAEVVEISDSRIWVDSYYFDYADIGKTVFLTKEQAEQALKETEGRK